MTDRPAADAPLEPGPQPAGGQRSTFQVPPPDDTVPAPKPGGLGYHVVKRAFDIVFSLIVIVLLAIPVAIVCVIICIESPGAPIFTQERVGWRGRPVRIYKLRTMYQDAHDHPERYLDEAQMREWEREQKVEDDPRATRVGRFLRRTSLDELPQFLNVLKGELSVKPGITGWWQVTARNDATWESGDRQLLEVFYARHASLALDLRIFVRTFKAMGRGR